jgi:catechol 2,3-dioxygenase-like lactoylglutathione lyase family enzyme
MAGGIPTATNVDHVCYTVPDLDAAVSFFVDVIGAELVVRDGPYVDEGGTWMYDHLRMHPRSSLNAALLRLGPTITLELYEVSAPDKRSDHPRPQDNGAPHLSFHVGDVDAAYEYLRGHGLTMHGEPSTHEDGPFVGCRWVHFEAPWGLVLEVVNWPSAMPYESTTDARLARPAWTWDERP